MIPSPAIQAAVPSPGLPDDQYYNPFHTQLGSVCSLPSTLACCIYTRYILLHTVHVLLAYSGILLLHTIIIPNNTPPPTQYTILFCNSTYIYCFHNPVYYSVYPCTLSPHPLIFLNSHTKWEHYLSCGDLPDPSDEKALNTYLSLYEEDSSDPSIEGTLEGIKHCLTVSSTCL